MIFQDETWKWLEGRLKGDLEASTNKLYNATISFEEVRKLQGRIELIRTLLNSPEAEKAAALTRTKS